MRRMTMTIRWIGFLTILMGWMNSVSAQTPPNCPPSYSAGYVITGDSVSFCLDGVNLTCNAYSTLHSTDSYSVANIPYNPYPWNGANQVLVNIDDAWSQVVTLPFAFCYFGQKYNQVQIGANGQLFFGNTQPVNTGGTNPWASNGLVAPTANNGMNNCIMAPYHDIDPGVFFAGSQVTWDIYGTYPCRYLVVSWDSIPMFQCNNILASQQIVLFESTYLIDINIKEKPICSTWNGGVAHEGIQNANGTVAFMVPGRNGTVWQATNDSYRFTPAGVQTVNYQYYWVDVTTGDTIGTGQNLNYFPTQSTQVTVQCYAVTDCDTIAAFFGDTINVIVTGNVIADFSSDIHLGCEDDTVHFTNLSTSTAGGTPTYLWNFGDGVQATTTNASHIYANQNVYNVMLIASDNGCIDTMVKTINLLHPIQAGFAATGPSKIDSVCLGEAITVTAGPSSQPPIGFITYQWDFGDGSTLTTTADPSVHTYTNPGTYLITLVVTDTLGCTDTFSHSVFVDNPPYVAFTVSDDDVCVGSPIFFRDTMALYTQHFYWNFGNLPTNTILYDVHNPTFTYSEPGNYTVTLTGEYLVCNDATVTKNITVNAFPKFNLGPDTMICPGLTGAIELSDPNSTGINSYLWSTGETSSSILVTQPGYYWLKGSNGECTTTDSIWVKRDCYINIPNSFSPNNDGLNDYFLPRELLSSGLGFFRMRIFNRWGEEVFYTTALDGRGWDGKFDGKEQPQGVYVYVIDATFINSIRKTFKGNVTLMR